MKTEKEKYSSGGKGLVKVIGKYKSGKGRHWGTGKDEEREGRGKFMDGEGSRVARDYKQIN